MGTCNTDNCGNTGTCDTRCVCDPGFTGQSCTEGSYQASFNALITDQLTDDKDRHIFPYFYCIKFMNMAKYKEKILNSLKARGQKPNIQKLYVLLQSTT